MFRLLKTTFRLNIKEYIKYNVTKWTRNYERCVVIFRLHLRGKHHSRHWENLKLHKRNHVACEPGKLLTFLGAFAKLRKATINFVMFVRPSIRLSTRNNSAPTGRIFIQFDM